MTKDVKTQWHPAFCSALKLELREDAEYLSYTNEYNINSKPIQADLLIIKKPEDIQIKNEIGKLFRGHNLVEYKSPEDSLNVDTLIKVIGYACIYKANETHVDEISLDDITLTLVREHTPRKLLQWLKTKEFSVVEKYEGIIYLLHKHCFPIQVIVSQKLSKEHQKWLTLLHDNLDEEDVRRAVLQSNELKNKGDKDNADSVLQVAIKQNREIFEMVKEGDDIMCEALRELMESEIKEALAKATEKGLTEGRERGLMEGREKGRAEGRVEGRVEGELLNLFKLVQKNLLTKEVGAREAELSVEEFVKLMKERGYSLPEV